MCLSATGELFLHNEEEGALNQSGWRSIFWQRKARPRKCSPIREETAPFLTCFWLCLQCSCHACRGKFPLFLSEWPQTTVTLFQPSLFVRAGGNHLPKKDVVACDSGQENNRNLEMPHETGKPCFQTWFEIVPSWWRCGLSMPMCAMEGQAWVWKAHELLVKPQLVTRYVVQFLFHINIPWAGPGTVSVS